MMTEQTNTDQPADIIIIYLVTWDTELESAHTLPLVAQ